MRAAAAYVLFLAHLIQVRFICPIRDNGSSSVFHSCMYLRADGERLLASPPFLPLPNLYQILAINHHHNNKLLKEIYEKF